MQLLYQKVVLNRFTRIILVPHLILFFIVLFADLRDPKVIWQFDRINIRRRKGDSFQFHLFSQVGQRWKQDIVSDVCFIDIVVETVLPPLIVFSFLLM